MRTANSELARAEGPGPYADLVSTLEAGIRVLRDRDRLPLPDELIRERARNMATALLGAFSVTPLAPMRESCC
jgi:hypothetical protein